MKMNRFLWAWLLGLLVTFIPGRCTSDSPNEATVQQFEEAVRGEDEPIQDRPIVEQGGNNFAPVCDFWTANEATYKLKELCEGLQYDGYTCIRSTGDGCLEALSCNWDQIACCETLHMVLDLDVERLPYTECDPSGPLHEYWEKFTEKSTKPCLGKPDSAAYMDLPESLTIQGPAGKIATMPDPWGTEWSAYDSPYGSEQGLEFTGLIIIFDEKFEDLPGKCSELLETEWTEGTYSCEEFYVVPYSIGLEALWNLPRFEEPSFLVLKDGVFSVPTVNWRRPLLWEDWGLTPDSLTLDEELHCETCHPLPRSGAGTHSFE
jgi:hypothetical protein